MIKIYMYTCTVYVLEISITYLLFQLWLFNADTAVITNVDSLKAVVKTGIYSIRNKGINGSLFFNFCFSFVSLMPCYVVSSFICKRKNWKTIFVEQRKMADIGLPLGQSKLWKSFFQCFIFLIDKQ